MLVNRAVVSEVDNRRVWIANLPQKFTEYQVLNLVKTFGELVDFSFPVQKSPGPLQGSSVGYCFVTFKSPEEAKNAIKRLNGLRIFGTTLAAQCARPTRGELERWRFIREEAEKAKFKEDIERREAELAQRLTDGTASSSGHILILGSEKRWNPQMQSNKPSPCTSTSTTSTVIPDLYGKLGQVSAADLCLRTSSSHSNMNRSQRRRAVQQLEEALEESARLPIEPAILRGTSSVPRKTHPLVAALLAGGRNQNQPSQRGRGGRYHPYK